MFSQIYSRARSLLSRTPSEQDTSTIQSLQTDPYTGPHGAMVATRRPAVDSGNAKARSKRTLDDSSSPVSDAKRKRPAVDHADGGSNSSETLLDTIVVHVREERDAEGNVLDLREQLLKAAQGDETSAERLVLRSHRELSEEDVEGVESTKESSSRHTKSSVPISPSSRSTASASRPTRVSPSPRTQRPVQDSETSEQRLSKTTPSASQDFISTTPVGSQQAGTPSRQSKVQNRQASSSQLAVDKSRPREKGRKSIDSTTDEAIDTTSDPLKFTSAASTTRKHIRFGSEEPEVPLDTSPPLATIESHTAPADEDLSSDDDEAPETITHASAIQQTKASAAEASKAIGEAVAASERKRQERAERRAEEQKQKQRRQEKSAKKAQKKASKLARLDTELPDLLPESLLAAAPEKRPLTPPPEFIDTSVEDRKVEQQKRHIKFLEQADRYVKDVKRGPIRMRVLAKPNELLTPKVNLGSRGLREHWLRGREKGKGKGADKKSTRKPQKPKAMERKSFGGSFLRKKAEF
ncbi:uncharacterized protein BDZ99DRAFT_468140 [Mytilinidion resinicola]|uniref:Uncharacterized protein n=1 Tax=Mytilinidion resinicola TaxID=574789 RepID=A0A6A6Y446_9PEZI|nr:uncharacterized protein BDZ99DRAFT_468140 [Mytilinidion resinicola]KAF2803611.1 hypothetical protein BDZ99DRAFT_468140 [Mytilinidion resinicola]